MVINCTVCTLNSTESTIVKIINSLYSDGSLSSLSTSCRKKKNNKYQPMIRMLQCILVHQGFSTGQIFTRIHPKLPKRPAKSLNILFHLCTTTLTRKGNIHTKVVKEDEIFPVIPKPVWLDSWTHVFKCFKILSKLRRKFPLSTLC